MWQSKASPTYWAYQLKPKEDELLSSWLCRNARFNGLNPYRFCQRIFPGLAIWDRDIDLHAPLELIEGLNKWTSMGCDQLQKMTMHAVLRNPKSQLSINSLPAVFPMVLSLGVFGRYRSLKGTQYCPVCLKEDQYFSKRSRLAFVTHCHHHKLMLLNSCPFCDAPVMPHKTDDMTKCAVCRGSLIGANNETSAYSIPRISFHIERALRHGSSELFGEMISTQCLIMSLRKLIGVILEVKPANTAPTYFKKRDFESMCARERTELLRDLDDVCSDWPFGFREVMEKHNVTQRKFIRSSWVGAISREISKLPSGRRANRDYQPRVYNRHLMNLRRQNKFQYRLNRAHILTGDMCNG